MAEHSSVGTFVLNPVGAVVAGVMLGQITLGGAYMWELVIGALVGYFFVAHLGGTARFA